MDNKSNKDNDFTKFTEQTRAVNRGFLLQLPYMFETSHIILFKHFCRVFFLEETLSFYNLVRQNKQVGL